MSDIRSNIEINMDLVYKVRGLFFEDDQDKCWPWYGNINPTNGYPRIRHKNIVYLAHRVITIWANNLTKSPLLACHSCNNKICMNYKKHLYLGSISQNAIDSVNAGTFSGLYNKGENHGMSTITEQEAKYIKQEVSKGRRQIEIARELEISQPAVSMIINSKRWKHI